MSRLGLAFKKKVGLFIDKIKKKNLRKELGVQFFILSHSFVFITPLSFTFIFIIFFF